MGICGAWACARPSRCGYVRKLVNNKTLECAFIDGLVVVSPADRLYLPSGDHLRQNQLTFDFMFAFRQRIFVSKVQVKKVAFPDFPPGELPGGPPDEFTSAPLCEELGIFILAAFLNRWDFDQNFYDILDGRFQRTRNFLDGEDKTRINTEIES